MVGLGLGASSLGPGPPPFCQGEPSRSILAGGKGSLARPGRGSRAPSLPCDLTECVHSHRALWAPQSSPQDLQHIPPALRSEVGTARDRKETPRRMTRPNSSSIAELSPEWFVPRETNFPPKGAWGVSPLRPYFEFSRLVKCSMTPPRCTGKESSGCTIPHAAEQTGTRNQPENEGKGHTVPKTTRAQRWCPPAPLSSPPASPRRPGLWMARSCFFHLLHQPGNRSPRLSRSSGLRSKNSQ